MHDLLLFSRGDSNSIEITRKAFKSFSNSTDLKANPAKFHIYFGGVEPNIREENIQLTSFKEGSLPFLYLGVPMTSKKLTIHHYMHLIDIIVGRITHWSARLLNYTWRIQLLKNVTFVVMSYWMQCFRFPGFVLHKINVICRTFIWTGGTEISRKTPILWKSICMPTNQEGLNLFNLDV